MSTASYDFLVKQANTIPIAYPEYTPPPQPDPRDEFTAEIGDLEGDRSTPVPRLDDAVKERVLVQTCRAQMAQMGRAWVKH